MSSGTAILSTSSGRRTMYSPFRENIATIVNSNATSVSGLTRGMKVCSYHSRPFARSRRVRVGKARAERDSKGDENALCNLCDRDIYHRPAQAEHAGQYGDEHPCIHRVEEDLEERVEGDEAGGVLRVALG